MSPLSQPPGDGPGPAPGIQDGGPRGEAEHGVEYPVHMDVERSAHRRQHRFSDPRTVPQSSDALERPSPTGINRRSAPHHVGWLCVPSSRIRAVAGLSRDRGREARSNVRGTGPGGIGNVVGQGGVVVYILVQPRHEAAAAEKGFFHRLLTGLRCMPRAVLTNKLASLRHHVRRRLRPAVSPPVQYHRRAAPRDLLRAPHPWVHSDLAQVPHSPARHGSPQ